jgi:hypothetical protein
MNSLTGFEQERRARVTVAALRIDDHATTSTVAAATNSLFALSGQGPSFDGGVSCLTTNTHVLKQR